ncbi:class I adenylate-forming enzyme family protein [Planctomicrobium piriforme]|uniref:Long-chain acyl-CoA synthetase n=1 Tax=Planctomicrobium piriforme TaxID=1576369 RepID=A0A1I3LET1_9PLAN|nr:class I adenylate-forming enzyme family protein [Planctomicrobium piriforme]SFI82895.1 long-chain acyl-CoA synthetase [Planctomicrobium piriforme]
MNIGDLLRDSAKMRPGHAALIYEGRTYSYGELDRLTDRFATVLQVGGVQAGQVIGLLLESGPELLIAAIGAFKAGVVPNIVNAMLRPEEVRVIIADSEAVWLLTDAERERGLQSVRERLGVRRIIIVDSEIPSSDSIDLCSAHHEQRSPIDSPAVPPHPQPLSPEYRGEGSKQVACLLYTSGTTGQPKGVMLTHLNVIDNAVQFARVHFGPDDMLLVAAPLFHCWGIINGVLGIWAAGGTAVVIRRFKADPVLELIEKVRPTQFLGVPAMVNHMTRSPARAERDLRSLRVIHSAAAPMPAELISALRDDWKVGYAESYGLTEVSPVITTTPAEEMRAGSCGRAMGDTELKVVCPEGRTLGVDVVGELWARGTAVSAGYYKRPEATAEVFVADGWFRTGDIVRMDADGYVFLVDRAKDMINVGGEKVYPRDVEEVIFRHPAVADAVVVAAPDPVLGEVPRAVVALKPGAELAAEALIAFLRPVMATFKLPRTVEFVEAVPRSASGKALRRLLR